MLVSDCTINDCILQQHMQAIWRHTDGINYVYLCNQLHIFHVLLNDAQKIFVYVIYAMVWCFLINEVKWNLNQNTQIFFQESF